ncbi:LysE family translocator [Sulfurimonas sp.]|uniref:LysE family translocator n=1 Tax=Sulfurimonas sp. TaxID=2022749 RepID=UPI002AB133CB|nr:LysE family translocator [Sulfurimonas sp.]
MILSFFEGFLLGLGAAVPLGPINILIMNEAIKKYKNGVMIGLGAMSADMTYLFLIVFGLISYFNHPEILKYLSIFGGLFLIYLALNIFKSKDNKIAKVSENIADKSSIKLYFKGFALTFINPYTIGFWLSVSGHAASKELSIYATLLGMISAILLWIIIMPYFVHRSKHKISQRVSYWISVVSSIILLGFGLFMLF